MLNSQIVKALAVAVHKENTIILYSNTLIQIIIMENFMILIAESMDVKIADLYSLAGHGRAGHLGESQAVAGVLGQGGPINKV